MNTGSGWATWNPDGTFASMYVRDSWAHRTIPVLTYYMLLQSSSRGGDEAQTDLAHLHDPELMQAYLEDVRLLFRRVRGARPVVVHVEPDLWGYLEQAGEVALASSFAQTWVRLRDQLAPNAILVWDMSGWGTKHDIVYEDPPDAAVRAYAARSAAADFHRHLLYGETFVRLAGIRMAAWQIPLGNTLMRAMDDRWGHFQDNRVQWLLGSRTHLRAYASAGYVGFLFGGGADGTTCACDAQHDGVTNPAPIAGNTRASLSADDDGGLFRSLARSYYRAGPLRLPR